MDCEQIQERISAMLDGELSETDRALVSEHMEHCPECRAVYEAFLAVSDCLNELEEPPEGLTGAVMERVHAKAKPPRRGRRLAGFAAMAACLALVLLAGQGVLSSKSMKDAATADHATNESAPMMMSDTVDGDGADLQAKLLSYDSAVLVQNSISLSTKAGDVEEAEPDADVPETEYAGAGVEDPRKIYQDPTDNGMACNTVNVESLDVILAVAAPAEYGNYEGVSDYTVVFYSGEETHSLDVWVEGERLYCQDAAANSAYYAEGTYAQLLQLMDQ